MATTSVNVPTFLGTRKKKPKKARSAMNNVIKAIHFVDKLDISPEKVIDAMVEVSHDKIADKLTEGIKDEKKRESLRSSIIEELSQ